MSGLIQKTLGDQALQPLQHATCIGQLIRGVNEPVHVVHMQGALDVEAFCSAVTTFSTRAAQPFRRSTRMTLIQSLMEKTSEIGRQAERI